MNNLNKKMILFTGLFLATFLISALKLSFCWGSTKFFFSGINFIIPAAGFFLGLPLAGFFVFLSFIFKQIFLGQILTFGLPTVAATLNVASSSKKSIFYRYFKICLSFVLPLVCMILFILHPVGRAAYIYSFYWFIPMLICLLQLKNRLNSFFYTALQSTFVAHALGSIIWLYILPMTPQYWLALIPIVAIERLVFASGITLVVKFIGKFLGYNFVKKIVLVVEKI